MAKEEDKATLLVVTLDRNAVSTRQTVKEERFSIFHSKTSTTIKSTISTVEILGVAAVTHKTMDSTRNQDTINQEAIDRLVEVLETISQEDLETIIPEGMVDLAEMEAMEEMEDKVVMVEMEALVSLKQLNCTDIKHYLQYWKAFFFMYAEIIKNI